MTRRQWWIAVGVIVLLTLAASWNGIYNDFTYDDKFIVLGNVEMHNLHNWWRFFDMPYWPVNWGSDGYRPLTILAFSLEWAAGHGTPLIYHAMNIGLYAATSVAVFCLAETILPVAAAWVAAALFAVHPLHVEAVANVVGQAELFVALFVLIALNLYIRRRNADDLTIGVKIAIVLLYALACTAKEHGFVLPALLLVAEVIVVVDKTSLRQRLVALRPFGLSLCLVAAAYLWAHSRINNDLAGFHPYVPFETLGLNTEGRMFTMLGLVPDWFRLFFWPLHLSAEYGPPAYPVVNNFQLYQVPGLIALLGLLGLGLFSWKRQPALSFGVWFTVITLLPTSNFIVPSGILLAERTLFLPSAGMMIVAACAVPWIYRRFGSPLRIAAVAALVAFCAAGIWRSDKRTKVWKDDNTLFSRSVIDAPNVYRTHFMLGAWKIAQKRQREGEQEYLLAMALYDKDPYLYFSLGEEYRDWTMFEPAIAMFKRALEVDTTMFEARARLALSLAGAHRWSEADHEARLALKENTQSAEAMLGVIRLAAKARKTAADSVKRAASGSGKLQTVPQKAVGAGPPDASRVGAKPRSDNEL